MIKRLCGFEKVRTIEEIAKNGYLITLDTSDLSFISTIDDKDESLQRKAFEIVEGERLKKFELIKMGGRDNYEARRSYTDNTG